ncbi:MAG: fused DSP-PTPase phosphatase/NAD kinase-like protein [Pyrinomonadaceae bacterium]
MKVFSLVFVLSLIFIFTQGSSAQDANASKKDLPNFYLVNSNLYRGGQPKEAGIERLKKMGVKTIIDLRGADDDSKKEEIWAKNAGIKFITVNLQNWLRPKTSDIEQIINYINQPENQPVFVHCRRGADRTGTVIAVYRIRQDGWTARQATDEAKKFGFGWWQFWMKDYISDYYRDFHKTDK